MLAREGLQTGDWQWALLNSTPRAASRSICGVFACGCPPMQPIQSLRSSRKHKELDTELEVKYNNMTVTDEVRKMKTMKLYLKDEIHRINARLIQLGLE